MIWLAHLSIGIGGEQSKFIANSCRVYEFWGYEWRMPFWDIEFINFWNDLPLQLRLEKFL